MHAHCLVGSQETNSLISYRSVVWFILHNHVFILLSCKSKDKVSIIMQKIYGVDIIFRTPYTNVNISLNVGIPPSTYIISVDCHCSHQFCNSSWLSATTFTSSFMVGGKKSNCSPYYFVLFFNYNLHHSWSMPSSEVHLVSYSLYSSWSHFDLFMLLVNTYPVFFVDWTQGNLGKNSEASVGMWSSSSCVDLPSIFNPAEQIHELKIQI